ncbi:MAG: GNAT family N-acetyltransferase [Gammaproteobacteria bacterium]
MKQFDWQCKRFAQLSNDQLYELVKFRVDIFVVEQHCPYPELDDKDRLADTLHLIAYQHAKIIAYARLLPPGASYSETSIGRFAVAEPLRREGIGSMLMDKCLEQIATLWPDHDTKVSAQAHLENFYAAFGFIKNSHTYLEDNIPHIEMFKTKSHAS